MREKLYSKFLDSECFTELMIEKKDMKKAAGRAGVAVRSNSIIGSILYDVNSSVNISRQSSMIDILNNPRAVPFLKKFCVEGYTFSFLSSHLLNFVSHYVQRRVHSRTFFLDGG